ncbi:MAG: ABC transporter ATP-binding protein [Desulfobacula sp.]|nr:ABC transporter ATP-binding protein [Desulfobacula sp.]
MPKKIIDINALCHTFSDGYVGLKEICVSIYKGEFIILAGKNGSGKTTFLRHLNGLLLPDSGQIRVKGHIVSNHLIQTRKTIGMVFQDADTQIVGDTVFDEVAFGLENLKFSRADINEKVTQTLNGLNLFHLKDRSPSTLSGGEKRRLAIAGILVMDPAVAVFDEPFSNLDYPGTLQVLTTIIELNRSGHTIIIATHDIETVICEATRLIIMENGRIKEDGAPSDLVKHLESYGVKEPCSSKFGLGIQPWRN